MASRAGVARTLPAHESLPAPRCFPVGHRRTGCAGRWGFAQSRHINIEQIALTERELMAPGIVSHHLCRPLAAGKAMVDGLSAQTLPMAQRFDRRLLCHTCTKAQHLTLSLRLFVSSVKLIGCECGPLSPGCYQLHSQITAHHCINLLQFSAVEQLGGDNQQHPIEQQ